jgi:cyclic pyranopterin phosphate synthase
VKTADRTGVEMEALTAVSVAALTLVDMVKAVDPAAVITDIKVEEKLGGKTQEWRREAPPVRGSERSERSGGATGAGTWQR